MRKLLVRARERGASAVEFALVMPVLLIMLMGMIDFGLAINAQAVLSNAAREAARAGSFNATDSAATTTVALNSSSTLLGDDPTVDVTCTTMSGSAINCSSAVAGDVVKVNMKYRYYWISPGILGLPAYTDLQSGSQMRIEST